LRARSFRYAGVAVPLTAGAGDDTFATGDAGIAHPLGRSGSTSNLSAVHVYEV
jgi:hypothetical protein